MGKMVGRTAAAVTFFLLCTVSAEAQYYDWGQNPASIRWSTIRTGDVRCIFPDYYSTQAGRLMYYLDTIRPRIGYGYTLGPMRRMPLILHTQNFAPNGIVMLAPKRMEFIVIPPASQAAMPWLKQLAVHEYRHAVQYNNLNRGVIRVLSYILGSQGSLIGLGFMPVWAMEGDAVMAETEMSSFGRGLQPSFTIEYRAMALEDGRRFPVDKYFSGSFRDYMPDHYQLGYQMTSYACTRYGENVWDRVTRFGSSRPYMLFTPGIALRRYYGTSVAKLFRDTFDDLDSYWKSLPLADNSSAIIKTPVTSYTVYATPVAAEDGTVYAIKSDLDRAARLVRVDMETGKERTLRRIGAVNTGLNIAGDMLWWTEYRQSVFWEQRVNSQLCWYDLSTGRKGISSGQRKVLFTAAFDDGSVARAVYGYDGAFAIKHYDWTLNLPDTLSVHGLAYDDKTEKYYFIALSDGGMWIGSAARGDESFDAVTPAGYTSLYNLRAKDGRLYFNSIASGKDEAHCYDLDGEAEYRLTGSRYGSFSPSPLPSGDGVVLTTYTPEGYMLAVQRYGDAVMERVPHSLLPQSTVNPPRAKWDIMNIDRVVAPDSTSLPPARRYRKALHAFNFHSWAPFFFDADNFTDETAFNVRAGATVLSQNNLNSVFSQFGYFWDGGHSHLMGWVNYYGLAPKFEVRAHWSNADQLIYRYSDGGALPPAPADIGNYFDLAARVYLPVLLSSGSHIRRLTPEVEFEHNNARLYNHNSGKYSGGLQKTVFKLQFTDNARMAYRDFLPRWGYAVRTSYAMNPFRSDFGSLWSILLRGFLPGIADHHSLMLRTAFQYQWEDIYNYRQKELFPRGADFLITPRKYVAYSVDYQFPFWYPDGGISSFIFFKRLRANLFWDHAHYRVFSGFTGNIHSYGLDLIVDFSPFRIPSTVTPSVVISLQKPSDRKGVVIGFSLSVPV